LAVKGDWPNAYRVNRFLRGVSLLESAGERQAQLQPALLRLSAMISKYFTGRRGDQHETITPSINACVASFQSADAVSACSHPLLNAARSLSGSSKKQCEDGSAKAVANLD
jgi:hypothetical protein